MRNTVLIFQTNIEIFLNSKLPGNAYTASENDQILFYVYLQTKYEIALEPADESYCFHYCYSGKYYIDIVVQGVVPQNL